MKRSGPFSGALRNGPPFHGSRSLRKIKFRMRAVKRAVAKLHGDKLLLSAGDERSRSYRVTNEHPVYDSWISGPLRCS